MRGGVGEAGMDANGTVAEWLAASRRCATRELLHQCGRRAFVERRTAPLWVCAYLEKQAGWGREADRRRGLVVETAVSLLLPARPEGMVGWT